MNDTASVKGNWGPPLMAMNCCPSKVNVADTTSPGVPGPASVNRSTRSTDEFGKIAV